MRTATLRGRVVGPIWQPGIICEKYVTARIERSDADTFPAGGPYPDLRTAMLSLTAHDGDFQACGFDPDETWITVEEWDHTKPTRHLRTRQVPIRFACWHTDDMKAKPEWLDES
jgi:hypothetical protein